MGCRRLATLLVLLALPVSPRAARAGSSCAPTALPDNAYAGGITGMVCCDFSYHEVFPGTVEDVFAQVNVTHTWVGDLVIKVRSPSLTDSTLQSRAGSNEPSDDGVGGCCGNSANWPGVSISYDEHNGGPLAELMGFGLSTSTNVCTDNSVCKHTPAPGAGPGNGLDVDFDGETYIGDWKVCVGDAEGADTGTYNDASFTLKFNRRIPCACGGKFRGGDRVRFAPQFGPTSLEGDQLNATPDAVLGGPAPGTLGEAECGIDIGTEYILVKWDGFTGGHDGNGLCQCPTGNLPGTAGYYIVCDDLAFDLPWSDDFESGDTDHWTNAQGAL